MRKSIIASCAVALALMPVLPAAMAQESKTAKERSSRKWLDAQRTDNCRVPVDKRGPTPRPDCPGEQSAATR